MTEPSPARLPRRHLLQAGMVTAVAGAGSVAMATTPARASTTARGNPDIIVAASNAMTTSQLDADYQCDGTADDVEINAAIAAATAAGGARVRLTEGRFTVADSDSDGHCVRLAASVELVGQGSGTVIVQASGIGGKMVSTGPSAVDDARVTGVTVDGNQANNTGSGSHCFYAGANTTRFTVSGVIGHDAPGRGLSLNGVDNVVEGSEFHHNGAAGIGVESSAVRTRLQGNHCHDNGGDGIYTGSFEIICIGNRSYPNSDTGINLGGVNATTYGKHVCVGNECYLNANSGINSGGGKHVLISSNVCWANGRKTTTPRSNAGIRVHDNTSQNTPTTSDGVMHHR